MNGLITAIEKKQDYTTTLNGAPTFKSSGFKSLDLFSMGGSLRVRTDREIENLLNVAFSENTLLAIKTLFWIRDVRGGAGERKTFRVGLNWLAYNYPEILVKNIANVAEYGRYDDLLGLLSSPVKDDVVLFIQNQIVTDLAAPRPSLLGKWLPSINASSKETKKNGRILAKALGLTERQYRQVLTNLRGKIKIIESQMCAKEWDAINFEFVPSKAAMNYRKAFRKHSPELYEQYIKAVEKGEKTIKATTLFPYDIIRTVWGNAGTSYYGYGTPKKLPVDEVRTLDAQWKALPNYFEGNEDAEGLVVVDVSGSMMCNNGLPMFTSIGLGLYCAERAKGPFHNKYMTFASTPQLLTVTGKTIEDKVHYTRMTGVGTSTNLQAVFDLILTTALASRVKQSDMPKSLYIITDTEFNHPQIGRFTNFEVIKAKFAAAGYVMPRLVFWNVNSVKDSSPVRVDDNGVVLVSGQSPAIFKNLLSGKATDPMAMFLDVVNGERYEKVVV